MREEILTSLDVRISPHHVLCENHHTAALDESELDCTGVSQMCTPPSHRVRLDQTSAARDLMLIVTERRD